MIIAISFGFLLLLLNLHFLVRETRQQWPSSQPLCTFHHLGILLHLHASAAHMNILRGLEAGGEAVNYWPLYSPNNPDFTS